MLATAYTSLATLDLNNDKFSYYPYYPILISLDNFKIMNMKFLVEM